MSFIKVWQIFYYYQNSDEIEKQQIIVNEKRRWAEKTGPGLRLALVLSLSTKHIYIYTSHVILCRCSNVKKKSENHILRSLCPLFLHVLHTNAHTYSSTEQMHFSSRYKNIFRSSFCLCKTVAACVDGTRLHRPGSFFPGSVLLVEDWVTLVKFIRLGLRTR